MSSLLEIVKYIGKKMLCFDRSFVFLSTSAEITHSEI